MKKSRTTAKKTSSKKTSIAKVLIGHSHVHSKKQKLSVGKSLIKGLKSAVAYEKGKKKLRTRTLTLPSLSPAEIAIRYRDTLEHFIVPDCGGWPINRDAKDKDICWYVPALYIDKQDRIARDVTQEFDPRIVAKIWEMRYNDVMELYNNLIKAVNKITEEY